MSECGITNPYMNPRAKAGEAYEPTRHEHIANTVSHAAMWRRDAISRVLQSSAFGPLVNVYMIDHFAAKNLSLLSASCHSLVSLEPSDWSRVLDFKRPLRDVLVPLSLFALRAVVAAVSFDREPVHGPRDLKRRLRLPGSDADSEEFGSLKEEKALQIKMKEKKRHEVEKLAGFVKCLNGQEGETPRFTEVVDFGAGLGHLSRVLVTELDGVRVKTIEGNARLVDTARRLDERLEKTTKEDFRKPAREAKFIREEDAHELERENVLLLGLHACGELSAWILRRMREQDSGGLLLISCCHHKLNASSFPLSKAYEGLGLSYTARELACHALEQLSERLLTARTEDFMEQSFRAALEWAIVQVIGEKSKSSTADEGRDSLPDYRRLGLKGAKKSLEHGFEAYARRALESYPEIWKRLEGREVMKRAETMAKSGLNGLLAVHSIRTLMAPLIETAIVDDRLCALQECGWRAAQIPIFDPLISPRNFAIVALK